MKSTTGHADDVAARDEADGKILERIARGEAEALEDLYDRYRAIAYGVALRVTGDASVAEDSVQEAFIGAWRNAARYDRARASVKTWLLSIVHHRAVDAVRRRRPTTELPAADTAPTPAFVVPDVWPEVSTRLDGEEIRAALASLASSQREALELAYFGGFTQQEIATRTGTPLGTVKSRMRLGLVSLRRILEGGGERPSATLLGEATE